MQILEGDDVWVLVRLYHFTHVQILECEGVWVLIRFYHFSGFLPINGTLT